MSALRWSFALGSATLLSAISFLTPAHESYIPPTPASVTAPPAAQVDMERVERLRQVTQVQQTEVSALMAETQRLSVLLRARELSVTSNTSHRIRPCIGPPHGRVVGQPPPLLEE